jgi:glucose/arabinose dehydrogenase
LLDKEGWHNEAMRRLLVGATLLTLVLVGTPARAGGIAVQAVKTGLDFPAAFTLAPGGKIVYAERFTGEIRVIDPVTGSDTLFFTVTNVATSGEQGLLGVALHPQIASGQPFVYAYATRNTGTGLQNQILRIRIRAGGNHTSSVIFSSDVTPAPNHNGGVIHFGPDGRLYAQIGDAQDPANSQDLDVRAGKIVRMTASGGVPSDNPFVGVAGDDYVYSFGFRNGYGFTFDPLTDDPWETQNGPGCNDEINRLVPGGNFAWGPNQTCTGTAPQNTNQDGPTPRLLPAEFYTPTTAPTGIVFCDGCGLTGAEGHMFFGEYNTGRIREAVLTADRMDIASQTIPLDRASGILSMERGPNGTIYFSDAVGIYILVNA